MNVCDDSPGVDFEHACGRPSPWLGSPHTGVWGSAPLGGWNTTMSPTLGWLISRLVSTRWPTSRVGTIEGLGMRYGLTMNAWIRSARPTAIATVSTSSMMDFIVDLGAFVVERAIDQADCLTGSRAC